MKNRSEIRSQKSAQRVVIVGAGPAGASLAIRLRQENFRVVLIEREKFPRHKLCGEFISPECLEHFRRLGAAFEMDSANGERIALTVFYAENGKSVAVPSKWFGGRSEEALGLSRAEMDRRLLEKAREAGAEIFQEHAVSNLLWWENKVCGVRAKNAAGEFRDFFADLTIDATGRAKVLAKLAEREILRRRAAADARNSKKPKKSKKNAGARPDLVGFKIHLKNVRLPKKVCEIYFFQGGYGGLNYVENGIANHCFLIKTELVKKYGSDTEKILREVIFQNKRAEKTLAEAEPVFDWLAVSVDGFGVKDLHPAENLFSVGDAAAFIDPFTGSGMLMALESAEILAKTICANAPERIAPEYARAHRRKFEKRLLVCRLLRKLAFQPNLAKALIYFLNLSEKLTENLARLTREKPLGQKR